jgi:hypothetical protein
MTRNDDYLKGRDRESHLPSAGGGETQQGVHPPQEPVTVRIGRIEELPSTFDTVDGEWRTILTKNDPFAVLFLDSRNWRTITVGMVKSRHEILSAFWKTKIMALRSGNRTAILKKYGGPDQSQYLVESLPQILNDACEELSTEEKIRAAGANLERLRAEAALEEIARRLEFFLVDGEFTPLEARSLFAESDRLGLSDEMTAQFIAARLSDRSAAPLARPRGTSLKDQICSVTWSVSRSARVKGWVVIAFLVAALAIVMIALLRMGVFHKETPARQRPVPAHPASGSLLTEKSHPPPAAIAELVPSRLAAASSASPRVVTPKSEADLRAEREAVAAEMQRKSESEAQEAAQAAHAEIERSIPTLRDLVAKNRFDEVETESERLLTIAAKHSLIDDITTIREIASVARERKVDEKVGQERRAHYAAVASNIKQLTESGKYPEALSLASDILKDLQLPGDLREQIVESQNKARTELKRIMSSAEVKGGEVKPVRKH